MTNNAVLVVVTAEDCGGCRKHKPTLEASKPEFSRFMGQGNFIHVAMPTLDPKKPEFRTSSQAPAIIDGEHIPNINKPGLNRFVTWYPTYVLVSKRSWKDGANLEAEVFGGRMDPKEGMVWAERRESLTQENILNWVKEQLSSNIKFQGTSNTLEVKSPILSLLNAGTVKTPQTPQTPQTTPQVIRDEPDIFTVPTVEVCRYRISARDGGYLPWK